MQTCRFVIPESLHVEALTLEGGITVLASTNDPATTVPRAAGVHASHTADTSAPSPTRT